MNNEKQIGFVSSTPPVSKSNVSKSIFQRDYSLYQPYVDMSMHSASSWVKFGYNNLFPEELLELVNQSPLQKSILESKITYIIGAGLNKTKVNLATPNMLENWFSLMEKCITDYVYYGAFAVQVILNESGDRFSFYHQPVSQVRFGKYNEKNVIEKAFLCTNWRKAQRNRNVAEIAMYGSEPIKKGKPYLIYFKPYQPDNYYYAVPSYYSAANYIAADGALAQYYNNYIKNNFSANLAIKFPIEPSEEKKDELYKNIVNAFGGSENAGNILLLFGENGSLPDISSIESVDADLYNSVVDIIKMAIVSANRLTSPILAGISTSTGFSSKSDEIIAAAVTYRLTVINTDRKFILNCFNRLLEMNGFDRAFSFMDFDLRGEFDGDIGENNDIENNANNVNDNVVENNAADGVKNDGGDKLPTDNEKNPQNENNDAKNDMSNGNK